MKQDRETNHVVALGCVSTETEGGNWLYEDSEGGMSFHPGLADD